MVLIFGNYIEFPFWDFQWLIKLQTKHFHRRTFPFKAFHLLLDDVGLLLIFPSSLRFQRSPNLLAFALLLAEKNCFLNQWLNSFHVHVASNLRPSHSFFLFLSGLSAPLQQLNHFPLFPLRSHISQFHLSQTWRQKSPHLSRPARYFHCAQQWFQEDWICWEYQEN